MNKAFARKVIPVDLTVGLFPTMIHDACEIMTQEMFEHNVKHGLRVPFTTWCTEVVKHAENEEIENFVLAITDQLISVFSPMAVAAAVVMCMRNEFTSTQEVKILYFDDTSVGMASPNYGRILIEMKMIITKQGQPVAFTDLTDCSGNVEGDPLVNQEEVAQSLTIAH